MIWKGIFYMKLGKSTRCNFLKNKVFISKLELCIFIVFPLLYLYGVVHYFYTLPAPSDPLQYISPAVWKTTYAYWPWLDRITLAIGLRLCAILLTKKYLVGMLYIGIINIATLIVGMIWCYKLSGKWAALFFAIFFNTSYLILGLSSTVFPNQTVAFFALISLIFFMKSEELFWDTKFLLLSGIFSAFACYSKGTACGAVIFLLVYLLAKRNINGAVKFIIGLFAGTIITYLLFLLLYDYHSLWNIFYLFFKNFFIMTFNETSGRTNMVSFLHVILSVKYFPVFIALFVSLSAYKNSITRMILFYAWSYIVLIYVIYSFSSRGGTPIPHYIYSAYIFCAIALSVYLSNIYMRHKEKNSINPPLY